MVVEEVVDLEENPFVEAEELVVDSPVVKPFDLSEYVMVAIDKFDGVVVGWRFVKVEDYDGYIENFVNRVIK